MYKDIVKFWVIMALMIWSGPLLGLDKEEKSAIKAIKAGDIELLKSYLAKHPDLNCTFSNGKTGLYYAIVSDENKIAGFLLKRGADPNLTVSEYSMLEWAILYNRARIARFLIEFGAEVNRLDEKENTPLIYAAEFNNLEMCKILIDRGADPLHKNLADKRASDYAGNFYGSAAHQYLLSMEARCRDQESVPSMQDGPYIYWETDDRVVLTYYERNQDKNLTRLIEKTIETGKSDTIVQGVGWDKNSYHIRHENPPNPFQLNTDGKIFVVGDIHGKYDVLSSLLMKNNIIDSDLKWIFEDGHLVLLGDDFDRGMTVTETLWFLHELEIQARNSGGNVHLLLGNHEIMALTGDHRYLNDKYNYFCQYTQTEYSQLFQKNTVLGRWLRSKNLILRINDYLFVHAGISPQFALYNYPYPEINSRVQNYLNSDYTIEKGSPEDIILGPFGPLWYRGYRIPNSDFPELTQEFVDAYLNSKGLKRMIVGHNEQPAINSSYNGRIIQADVAIDESGRSAQGLLIIGDELFRCSSDGTQEKVE